MWTDPIVEEVRRVRQAHAAKFNYDLNAIYADIKAREAASGRKYVSLPHRPPTVTIIHSHAELASSPSS